MRKLYIYIMMFVFASSMVSCNDFGNVNDDPEHLTPEKMDYTKMFTQIEQQSCGSDMDIWRAGCSYLSNMLQHTATLENYSQGVFYTWDDGYNGSFWNNFYSGGRAVIRNATDIMYHWKDNSKYGDGYQMTRILKAYIMQRMTDLYGDVPYSEAGQGFINHIFYPKYDTQESIYLDLLNELDDAQAKLGTSKLQNVMASADIIYKGDASKWKKFANSLMLRVAMRLSKVKPDVAQKWADKALSNGLFDDISDNAMVVHSDAVASNDSSEPYGKIYSFESPGDFYLCEYFVNMLMFTLDPRLPLIATVCKDPKEPWGKPTFDYGNNNPDIQVGMPTGYETKSGKWSITNWIDYNKIPNKEWKSYFSQPNRYTYARPDAPTMFVTYAENMLLLAEAAQRGWIKGSAADYYNKGVTAAMQQFSAYAGATSMYSKYLTPQAIETYLTRNPFDASKALEQINTQYYITTFCDEYESFSNWRRSGFPKLIPVNSDYPNSTNGIIPRRLTYPSRESQINGKNYEDAVSRLKGGDKMTSRVWWDVDLGTN